MFRKSPETGNTDGKGTQEIYIWNKIETAWHLFIGKTTTIRGDLIETFKILTGRERIDSSNFFELSETTSGLRGHSLKLYKQRCCTTVLDSASSVRESSILGTDYLKMSSKQHQLTCSKTVWTSIEKIWASTADCLCSSSSPSTSTSNRMLHTILRDLPICRWC